MNYFLTTRVVVKMKYIYIMKSEVLYTCHSGGAIGADSYFEHFANEFGVQVVAYSYRTKHHQSNNKFELTREQYNEGVLQVYKANEFLKRTKFQPYLPLLARNWFQVKNVSEVFAIVKFKKSNSSVAIQGGTAWAVQMAIQSKKKVFIYNQELQQWYQYNYERFSFQPYNEQLKISCTNFAGIGTRKINIFGIQAIEDLFKNTFTI